MQKPLLLVVALLLVAAAACADPGAYLNWGDRCWGEAPVLTSTWACDSNVGDPFVLTLSFEPYASHDSLVAVEMVILARDQRVQGGIVDWWRMGTGECRSGAFTMATDLREAPTGCTDLWQGTGGGGIGSMASDEAGFHFDAVWAVPAPIPISAGTEYACAQFRIARAKTVGPGACAGCTLPMYVRPTLYLAFQGERNSVILEQGTGWELPGWQHDYRLPDPARPTTWGRIKSIYR